MQAAGVYLATIRHERGLTQQDVADKLQVDIKSIRNWEHGKKEPSSLSLAGFIALIEGNPEDVQALMIDDRASPELGRKKAQDWLRRDPTLEKEIDRLFANADPLALRQMLSDLAGEHERDPGVIDRVRAWLEGWRNHREQG